MTESSPLSQKINNLTFALLFLTLLVLPFQLGKHFWPQFAYILGQRVDYLSPVVYVSDICVVILFLLRAKQLVFGITKLFWIVLLFLSLTVFFSQNPMAGWYGLLKCTELVFFGWVIAQNTHRLFRPLFWSFGTGVVLEGFLGISEVINQGSVNGWWYFLGERSFSASTPGIANATIHGQLVLRPYATFPHPNVFAGYLVVVSLFFLATVLFTKEKLYKRLGVVLLGFGTLLLITTLSRVALVIWFALLLLAVLTKFRKRFWIGSLLLLMLLVLFADPVLSGRFFDVSSYTESIDLRLLLQQAALRMFTSHKLFGIGLDNFLVALPFFLKGHVLFGFLQPVHNMYLLVLAETGIVGIGLFLFLLVSAFSRASISWQQQPSTLSFFALFALIALLLLGLTDHYMLTLQQGQLLFALVLGLCFGHGTIPVWRFTKNLRLTRFIKS